MSLKKQYNSWHEDCELPPKKSQLCEPEQFENHLPQIKAIVLVSCSFSLSSENNYILMMTLLQSTQWQLIFPI